MANILTVFSDLNNIKPIPSGADKLRRKGGKYEFF